jgi:hypothetical protein
MGKRVHSRFSSEGLTNMGTKIGPQSSAGGSDSGVFVVRKSEFRALRAALKGPTPLFMLNRPSTEIASDKINLDCREQFPHL